MDTIKIKKTASFALENSAWDSFPWKDLPSVTLLNHMGEKPVHFPKTQVKLTYGDTAIYVMFRVEDRYVKAVAKAHQDDVYKDSCVEFFFTPGTDPSRGYFNLEMNCGGTLLVHFQKQPRKDRTILPIDECRKITCVHSLPHMVDPEITDPVTWTVAYKIPIALLEKYCPVDGPAPKTIWRANFYKCADNTSHPHWLTWALVEHPVPDFHRPQFFGELQFE